MPTERRFDEAAITEIFSKAAEAQSSAQKRASSAEGLTLEELQEIGRDAGLSPEFVAKAAANLETGVEPPQLRRFMGVPVGVQRSVQLPGPMTDADWDRLVADLRSTFHARGKLGSAGNHREWSNGNLYALVEPGEQGDRLRLGTLKGGSREIMAGGIGLILMAFVGILTAATSGGLALSELLPLMMIAAGGVGMTGISMIRLPRWASLRERQMETVAQQALDRMERTSAPAAEKALGSTDKTSEARIALDELPAEEATAIRAGRVRG